MHAAVALAAATLSALAGCTMLHNRPAVVLAMAAPAPVLLTIYTQRGQLYEDTYV